MIQLQDLLNGDIGMDSRARSTISSACPLASEGSSASSPSGLAWTSQSENKAPRLWLSPLWGGASGWFTSESARGGYGLHNKWPENSCWRNAC
eukprot:6473958-Amphidinium_carterae.3